MANRFILNETSYHGAGAIKSIVDEAKGRSFKKAFVCSDPDLVKFGVTKKVLDVLDGAGLPYELYSNIKPNPTIENVQTGVEAFKASGADYIVAIGGGSSMDTAKAIGIIIKNPEFADVRSLEGVADTKNKAVPIFAVPTTAGTAAEVTINYVITDAEKNRKMVCVDPHDIPVVAFIDPDMMSSMPKGLTAASGIDALTHALEAYASIMATDYTDGLALKAMKNIFTYLPAAYENGPHDAKAREQMATASTMAGMAFANAFLGVCHSMAHKLGAFHHLPHGIANAILITDVMRFNAAEVPAKMGTFSQYAYPHCKERYLECANFLGIQGKNDDEKFENFLTAIEELKAKVGIKKTIKDYGVDEKYFLDTLDDMVEQAFDDQCTGANPRYPLMREIKEMYLKAYYGK